MLNSPGTILRQARNKLKYTIDGVHSATKIKKEYIKGLEKDDVSVFPAEVYYKNFLKSYALFLKLDSNKLIQMYEQTKIELQEKIFEQDNNRENKFVCFYKNNKKLLIYIGGFCVVIICFIIIVNLVNTANVINKKTQEEKINTNNIVFSSSSSNSAKVVSNTIKVKQQQKRQNLNINTTKNTANIINKKTRQQKAKTDNIVVSSSSPKVVFDSTHVRQQSEEQIQQKLYIKALADTWIKITADNKDIFEGTIVKSFESKADDEFVVKIGNVDTVEVYFNDELVDIVSGTVSKSRVKTITLKRSQN